MIKPCTVMAQDEHGKVAVLFGDDKKQVTAALNLFKDDDALAKAGLSGKVSVAIYRNPQPFRRRTAFLERKRSPGRPPKSDK